MSLSPRIALLFALLTLGLTPLAHAQTLRPEPEASTGLAQPEVVQAQHRIVVSAHPDATAAGYAVLERGGSALDAAIAVQAMLTLVEPQSSGIGGGAFLLYWDQSTGTLHAYDGREQAPAAADGDLFRQPDGTPMRWIDAVIGGRAVGAPGVLRMLELAHRAHGQLPWSELFDSAITRARDGFIVGERLHGLIAQAVNPGLGRYPEARDYFFSADGTPRPVGSRLRNPALARTLEQIARDGADAFYRGPLAQRIAARVQSVEDNPGRLTAADLAAYEAKVRTPLCRPYRQWQICGFPPPTSGGVTLLQILGLLEGYAPEQLAPDSAEFAHLFTQASRLAYADRARYLADPDYVEVPVAALLAPAYLQQRRQLIDPARDMGEAPAGALDALAWADDRSPELPSTSHFVIVDGDGNAVSMTSSIEHAFGSTLMVDGFLLNNQLTDFSFRAEQDGRPIANRVEPGKRPRSSMAPVMVFDSNGELVAALGSPGGSHIINYVAQTLVALLNSPLSLQQAIALPHVSNRNGRTALEQGRVDDALIESLRARGHEVELRDLNSGLHGVYRRPDGRWEAGVDPRREGEARGD